MTNPIVVLALLASGLPPVSGAQSREERVARAAAALEQTLVAQRRDFHQHPELSNREERTARVITEKLRALGFDDVRTGISGHGIVALLKGAKPGPVAAIRTDMDALPIEETLNVPYRSLNKGVKHACGHDVHMTVALGTAELLSRMRSEMTGSVKFIFQPAEEGAPEGEDSGADRMIREGALDNPRPGAIFAFHTDPALPAGRIGYVPGAMLASSDYVIIKLTGKKVHAAMPHQGIDTVVVAAECVTALQTIRSRRIDPLEPLVLTLGSIHGGNRSNIIAEEVVMEGTLRTHSEKVRERAMSLVREIVAGVAASHGAKAEVSWSTRSNPPTVNNTALVEATLPSLRRTLGAENVVLVPPVMAAEDFAYFQRQIPGAMFWLGVGNTARGITAALHTPDFDADESSLQVGVKAMANAVLDYLDRAR
ncbi:MAG TPA: M20 family metallopeptidase [Bryobacteraceae bacterium]|nr:M20 family metallopeptidase [Bryobacteraceae bacterium]